jgi:hypothetical protein
MADKGRKPQAKSSAKSSKNGMLILQGQRREKRWSAMPGMYE